MSIGKFTNKRSFSGNTLHIKYFGGDKTWKQNKG